MANKPCLRWTPTSWILLFVSGFVMGQQTDLKCNYNPDAEYVGNGMFDVYTFEVEEGILLEPGKIIGTITLPVDNFTNSFGYDEPYFSKPYNKKSSPLPKYFDIKFTNITTLQNSTSTTTKPRIKRDVATVRPISEHMSTLGSLDYYQNLTFYTNTTLRYNSGAMKHIGVTLKPTTASSLTTESVTNIELGSPVSTSTSNGGTSLPNLTSAPLNSTSHISASTSQTTTTPATTSDTTTSGFVTNVTSPPVTSNITSAITTASTPASPTECVVAQILQIFDLDREKQDTHYLTINENIGEMGLPTIVKLKVTDVNDNSPIFVNESLSSRITKDIQYGQVVAEIKATDADIGKNADLRYDIQSYSERRGNEKASPDFPTFLNPWDIWFSHFIWFTGRPETTYTNYLQRCRQR
uniref:protocadherin-like wing polarity protein stan n=1 Tax=Styela clava TaxID=7725 RepID=UPI001939326B|nr:protocadherin-like wing polarity protein stan [Styela clava]